MFEEIKENIINNFFTVNYLWTCCFNKMSIIGDMKKRCPFIINPVTNECNVIHMELGDNITLTFNLDWETREVNTDEKHKFYSYRLIKIS